MSKQPANVCVVGAGIIGSWAALHLREAGVSVTLIEQFPLPHTRGSSHGMSRAFRLLGELELDRLDYSFDRWQTLEKEIGQTLFVKTGLLNFGPPGDTDLGKFMGVLEAGSRPFEWLDSESIASRYPTLNYPDEWGAAWDPNGGILIAHRCVSAVQSEFQALGGRILSHRVTALNSNEAGGVDVGLRSDTSGEESVQPFDQVVVCAGPWTGQLVPELEKLLHSLATPVTYWRDPSGLHQAAKGFPILFNARLTNIYGIPSCEYQGLVKMLYHGGPESRPDTRDTASCAPYVEEVRNYVGKYLPAPRLQRTSNR